ncbi:hypothetical protein KRR39_02095 [Nocardioides panacis]|uniref:Uncharacterized protein n=1 Tax=Nocardioides panacis TaxID=2849501 RepID=A0A975Y0P2_9ACTN|nr:hypothetical protein [Nocardioides panacis]QWZ08676.1 hypothetical protein KRR39_02095 [Nocardioides panacis]
MRAQNLEHTRRSLHGVAELVLAGPQYAASQDIRLRVTPGGFGTVTAPDLRVHGLELVTPKARLPLGGTFAGLARAAGVAARSLRDVYDDGPGVTEDDRLEVEPGAVAVILDAFARADTALRTFAPEQDPVLWPEHFDVGISVDEVDYGVSPGDGHVAEPYAYVAPWSPRSGAFWNTPFGTARPLTELRDVTSLVLFFREGAARAGADPADPAPA